jgi:protease-4
LQENTGGPATPPSYAVTTRKSNNNRRGCLWAALILGGLGLLTLGSIFVALRNGGGNRVVSGGGSPAPIEWDEEYISGEGAEKVVVLPVKGVIGPDDGGGGLLDAGAATPDALRTQLRQAADDPAVRAVVLEVDSPGGGVVESAQMHRAIADFKRNSRKPVVVSMGATAASGGYYISTAADRILAHRSTLTGSLGVILSYLNYGDAARRYGLEEVVIKSGRFKDIGSPTRDLTPPERQILQQLVDESYNEFVSVIVQGRKLPEATVRLLADGRIYTGLQAQQNGLVDGLGDLQDAAAAAAGLAKVQDPTVVRYADSPGFFDLFRSRLSGGKPEAVKLLEDAGVSLSPKLQYLYRP